MTPVSDWQAAINRHDKAMRELRPEDAYTGITQTKAEIDAAFIAEFKLPREWDVNDIVSINTGTRERQEGVITGPVRNERVMVLFDDGIHWSFSIIGCCVKRTRT